MKLRPIGKKGDLSLSINAIVILILAITVMGLGLTFIRGLFSQATSKLGSALEATELSNPPTADKPLTIDQKIQISSGSEKTIQIGIYNPNTETGSDINVRPKITGCVNSQSQTVATDIFTIAAPAQPIPPRGAQGFASILTVKTGTSTGTYICTIGLDGNIPSGSLAASVSASTFIQVT